MRLYKLHNYYAMLSCYIPFPLEGGIVPLGRSSCGVDTASVGSVSNSSDISLFVAEVEGICSVGVDKDLSDDSLYSGSGSSESRCFLM